MTFLPLVTTNRNAFPSFTSDRTTSLVPPTIHSIVWVNSFVSSWSRC